MKKRLFAEMKLKRITLLLLLTASLLVGGVAEYFLQERLISEKPQPHYSEIREGGYSFVNPLLMCNIDNELFETSKIRRLKEDVRKTVNMIIAKKQADSVAVYFKEYKTGASFVIGENEKFHPASLMKVTTLAAVLKDAEADPTMLKKKIKYDLEQDHSATQDPKPSKTLEKGKEYTVEELLYRMIVYSDNNAGVLLEGVPSIKTLEKTYINFLIPNPYMPQEEDFVTVQEVAHIFRILYNGTFLDNERSERALLTLSRVEFKGGIRGGVPEEVTVAHKFGDWMSGEHKEKIQLHDCGIVYYPGSPYLLCIMTKGRSFGDLDASIKELSGITFNEVKGGSTRAYPAFAMLRPE